MTNKIVAAFFSLVILAIAIGAVVAADYYQIILAEWLGSTELFWETYLWGTVIVLYLACVLIAVLWVRILNKKHTDMFSQNRFFDDKHRTFFKTKARL
jgi:uncharacterized membrane protein